MAQKDKVKELVGRGLGSYHTKALQQIDRIEKKNKEQNHKINILTNELDNDYLTKTEEGSVVSLEHSKEGMVYLDELQGNTLVNYCTDGSKELTLNGEIDVEGTSVALTEGVDNGLVDVVCEGNTLVNLFKNWGVVNPSSWLQGDLIQEITGRNITVCNLSNKKIRFQSSKLDDSFGSQYIVNEFSKINITIPNDRKKRMIQGHYDDGWTDVDLDVFKNSLIILEGDWTNKEIPQYFEGMKSVGECEDNKIEILFRKEIKIETESGNISSNSGKNEGSSSRIRAKDYIEVKPSTEYKLTRTIVSGNMGTRYYDSNKNFIQGFTFTDTDTHIFETPSNCKYLRFIDESADLNSIHKLILTKDSDDKKEISLNEPLRGLPSGIKDRFIKQGGKWYVERNCGYVDDFHNLQIEDYGKDNDTMKSFYVYANAITATLDTTRVICDKFITLPKTEIANVDSIKEGCSGDDVDGRGLVFFRIAKSKLTTQDTEGFRQWLLNNNIKYIYELKTPTYEEITDVELITYLDITHISNNSTIPCNMVVKNSGYNAIIKPSTLYTVALDTNKSGTIGINLGGAKVTTTNNVATITTPATLTDDSLRLYGKSINASKVRLLEGDKDNWIPSHFEGMKSSFEDKLQEDGTFKMEILSYINNYIKILGEGHNTKTIYLYSTNNIQPYLKYFNLVDNYNECNNLFDYYYVSNNTSIWINLGTFNRTNALYILNQKISECEGKSNKIQFSSIEPLRGNKFTKDKFIFKDGKLMIERNFNKLLLDGNIRYPQWHQTDMYISIYPNSNDKSTCYRVCNIPNKALKWQSSISNMFTTCETNEAFGTNAREGYLSDHPDLPNIYFCMGNSKTLTMDDFYRLISENPIEIVYQLKEPTYEEIPFELQKIILEGYENGTLFFDTNIPPTVTTTYSGETPIVKATRLNKTEVLNNTNDINDNIVPYLMDMDYRVVCLQLEGGIENVSMARLFGGTYEMLQRDILSNRYSKEEYKHRLDTYLSANKITEDEYTKLGDMLND